MLYYDCFYLIVLTFLGEMLYFWIEHYRNMSQWESIISYCSQKTRFIIHAKNTREMSLKCKLHNGLFFVVTSHGLLCDPGEFCWCKMLCFLLKGTAGAKINEFSCKYLGSSETHVNKRKCIIKNYRILQAQRSCY